METSQKARQERGSKIGGEGGQVHSMQGSLSAAVPAPSCSQSTLLIKAGSMSMENPRGGISETSQKARKERGGGVVLSCINVLF